MKIETLVQRCKRLTGFTPTLAHGVYTIEVSTAGASGIGFRGDERALKTFLDRIEPEQKGKQ